MKIVSELLWTPLHLPLRANASEFIFLFGIIDRAGGDVSRKNKKCCRRSPTLNTDLIPMSSVGDRTTLAAFVLQFLRFYADNIVCCPIKRDFSAHIFTMSFFLTPPLRFVFFALFIPVINLRYPR